MDSEKFPNDGSRGVERTCTANVVVPRDVVERKRDQQSGERACLICNIFRLSRRQQDQKAPMLSSSQVDTVGHILEMLISLLSIDPESRKSEHLTPISQLVDIVRDYYTSEADLRPPPEPAIRVADLPVVLFQNLTSATVLEGSKARLGHHHLLRLVRTVMKKLKGIEMNGSIEWERESFLQWVATILEVGTRTRHRRRMTRRLF